MFLQFQTIDVILFDSYIRKSAEEWTEVHSSLFVGIPANKEEGKEELHIVKERHL